MGRVYYLLRNGTLSRKENTLWFENSEIRKFIPIEDVDEIFALSEINLSSKVLKLLSGYGIALHLFNQYGFYVGSFYPLEEAKSGYLTIKQAEHYLNKEKRLLLAKAFVLGAMKNLSHVYKLSTRSYEEELRETNTVEEVMSIEASFRKECYKKLEEETGMSFEKRSRRPPHNPLNALISFGNSLVYAKVLGEIYYTPLNPTISYLHEPSERRFSLSLDVAEVFKPILSDYLIIKLVRSGKIKEKHFSKDMAMAYLNEEGKRIFLSAFDERLSQTLKHGKLKRKVSIRRLIRIELYKLVKHLLGEEVYQPLDLRRLS